MKTFLAFILLGCLSVIGATRTASVTGNWTDTATWGGLSAPVSGDTVNINGNITVTIQSGDNVACARLTAAVTDTTSGPSVLVLNGKLTIDSTFDLRLGGTVANRDAKLIFGPGGELALSTSTSLYLNSCQVRSTATQGSPAKITGAGAITTLAAGPKQDIGLTNVFFLNTGTITFLLQDTLGANASSFTLRNCGFIGNAAIAIGSTTTPNTCPISITYSDFRDIIGGKTVTIRRITGGAAAYEFLHNTGYETTPTLNFHFLTSSGATIRDNAFYNCQIVNDAGAGSLIIADNLFASAINTPGIWNLTDAANGSVLTNNYLVQHTAGNNLRGLLPPLASTGGSGFTDIGWNILQTQADEPTHDKGDLIVARGNGLPIYVHHNLIVGAGEIIVGGRAAAWSLNITNKNNVISGPGPSPATSNIGHIYDPEGVANSGVITIANSLVYGLADLGDTTINGTASGGAQTIAYADYGNYYNIATPYMSSAQLVVTAGNTTKTVPGANDTAHNPYFYDSNRDYAAWNFHRGSGVNTIDAATDYFMGINGYRGTPNFDQNGTAATWLPSDMIRWVRAGYLTGQPLLRAAGDPADGSPDLGLGYTGLKGAIGMFIGQ